MISSQLLTLPYYKQWSNSLMLNYQLIRPVSGRCFYLAPVDQLLVLYIETSDMRSCLVWILMICYLSNLSAVLKLLCHSLRLLSRLSLLLCFGYFFHFLAIEPSSGFDIWLLFISLLSLLVHWRIFGNGQLEYFLDLIQD